MKQKTINIGGDKIVIKSRAKTRCGNVCGWNIDISDNQGNRKRYFRNILEREKAIDSAYVQFVKEYRTGEQK
jgi:hypothetical protein